VDPDSDISYIPAIIGFFVAIIAIIASFMFLGGVVGMIVLIVFLMIALYIGYRLLSQNDG